jgi:hypothetical protein
MTQKHGLDGAQTARGRSQSQGVRSAHRNALLIAIRLNLIELAKTGELGKTLKERADQLNERGVRTAKGEKLDHKKLSAAMIELGADKRTIDRLLEDAIDAADDLGVADEEMVDQLWHEWLYHHTLLMFSHGSQMFVSKNHPFVFQPVRPFDWEHPRMRDHRINAWWYGKKKVFPLEARLVFALFGMFKYEKRHRISGLPMFP